MDNIVPIFCLILMLVVMGKCTHELHTGDEYEQADAKYQCFKNGEQIYKSNTSPKPRGGNWWAIGDEKFQADDCFCMGCIGF